MLLGSFSKIMKPSTLIFITACLVWHFASAKHSQQVIEDAKVYCHEQFNIWHNAAYESVIRCHPTLDTPQDVKCYWQCFMQQVGWMDKDGNINKDPTELKPTPCYVKYGYECLNATGTDTCDKATNFIKCYFHKEQEDFDEHCIE